MKLLAGLLIALVALSSLSIDNQAVKSYYNNEFKADESLNDYINQFNLSLVDHSGLRSLINPLSVKETALLVIGNASDDLAKARLIHDFIRSNITYSVELDHLSAPEILKKGSGDCSEMSILAVSMLESLGITSYFMNGDGHACSVALINDNWVIIDPTQDFDFQSNWVNFLPENIAYLVNSSATLSFPTSASA